MKLNTQAIRVIMAEQELTQKAVAQRCGLSAQRFGVILRIGDCAEVTAGKLARGLGVQVKDIIEKEA